MGDSLTRKMNRVERFWNDWEIRGAIMLSLLIQILLLLFAGYRKRNYGMKFKTILISFSLWLKYLLADSVATFALGYLSLNEGQVSHLLVFWAPFLLLHLGGQDTITALSIEDNELWKRHMLTFVSEVGLAIYVFAKSKPPTSISWAASFIFIAGILKYVERIWALQKGSMSSLRSSMVTDPDPGPNYAKFMEEYYSSMAAGLGANIKVVPERRDEGVTKNNDDVEKNEPEIDEHYAGVVCKAYEFFHTFKRLFVDLILSFENRKKSQDYFLRLKTFQAYKVIEVELYFMYDILHTKAAVIHTWYGWIFRLGTLVCTITSLVIFTISNRSAYHKIEVGITYLLLAGAVLLEISALVIMLLSFWIYAAMEKSSEGSNCKCINWLAHIIFLGIQRFRPEKKSRWSNSVAQYSLINYSLKCKSNCIGKTMKVFGIKENWDHFWYTEEKTITDDLKDLVFSELKNKMKSIVDAASYRRFSDHRGQWALQRKGYYKELGWSVDAEFDESILLWHIATDLLFHFYLDENNKNKETTNQAEKTTNQGEETPNPSYSDISQHISNYMLFLLIVRPFMLPAGIGQIRFGDTCAEGKNFFLRRTILGHEEAAKMILDVKTDIDPRQVKGDRSKSVLFDGCKLAHQLQKLYSETEIESSKRLQKMWKLISVVWVEMLCYAASKCGGNFHAKQLSMGGEFLTHVWFLMAHLGMGEQYRIEAGHARAKLIVDK